ncbi:MAG: MEDS domain-containing protein, partial [Bacteroidota bacterium]|nr:MEDS domain-containing protein [Bacteroidota bacterium]
MKTPASEWQTSDHQIFWGEIAPAEHVVQIYENDGAFLNLLEGFVSSGITAGECVILIATAMHLNALTERLTKQGIDIEALTTDDQLILLDAKETLAQFMINGWPEASLFNKTVSQIIQRAKDKNRSVRAFGEMVALLWAEGDT